MNETYKVIGDEIISRVNTESVRDTSGRPIVPIKSKLSLYTNRHTNCDGTLWGWIEGCTNNVCWSNNKEFNYDAARKFVDDWNNANCVDRITEVRGEMPDLKLKSRAFIEEIKKLASKYDLPFFIVTDGASAYSNNGVEAIKYARESHKEWERQHGLDPDDDWNREHEISNNER